MICGVCGVVGEPTTINGVKMERPTGWADLTLAWQPIRNWLLCSMCVRAVIGSLDARRLRL